MNRSVLIVLAGLFLIGLVVFGTIGLTVAGLNNTLASQEEGLKAQYKQNQNNYDNYFKKLKETAQVPDQYVEQLRRVYADALKGRYGDGGAKAVFQAVAEQNPNVDAALYKQVQQVIESGRNSFQADQKTLLDKKRVYETQLRVFPANLVARALGYPTVDLARYDIVTSDETDRAFETKKSAPVNVFGKP